MNFLTAVWRIQRLLDQWVCTGTVGPVAALKESCKKSGSSSTPPAPRKGSHQNSSQSFMFRPWLPFHNNFPALISIKSMKGNCVWSVLLLRADRRSDDSSEEMLDMGSVQKLSSIIGNNSGEKSGCSLLTSGLLLSRATVEVSVTEDNSLDDGWGDIGWLERVSDDPVTVETEVEGSGFLTEPFGFSLFFRWVCHTFFISLSVRPGSFAAIADHLNSQSEESSTSSDVHENIKQI